jgi:ion channel-forming bestrophin family protein
MLPRADVATRGLMARWLIAFVRASKWYIREDEPLEEELRQWLEPGELRKLVSSPHPPNFCMLVLSHAVSSAGLSDVATVKLQEALAGLSMSLSACDRILNTPIPLSYTRQVGRRWLHKDVTSLTCQD